MPRVGSTASRTTYFTYDTRGCRIAVNAPDTLDADGGNLTNVTNTAYNPDGTVQETSGAQTYRTTQTYDYAQRMVAMTTYGTETATTTWKYSPERGFLLAKRDAANKGADYTYTAAGRLASRTWARSSVASPKVTEYAYDNAGRLVGIDYTDSTPDVTITYDTLNRQVTTSNGLATSTFAYNPGNLRIDTETISYDIDLDGTPELTRVLDRSQDNLSRDSGWELKSGTTVENAATYDYSLTDGRLSSISNPQSSNVSFDYGYESDSNLLKTITGPAHTVTNTYETTRNVLALKENKVATTNISTYSYGVNAIGQRTNVAKSGDAFGSVRDIAWGYDSLGQVTKADSTIPGLDRSYQFDEIGNRLKTADSLTLPTTNNYTPNALNQYTAIDSLTPGYDADGNMTSGPLPANVNANSTLVWDGENRLIEAQVNGGGTVNFVYDSQSRRITETIGTATTVHVYDGWNPIAEYSIQNSTFTIQNSYTWGMDLSGTIQGAGGVGGLLAVTDSTGTYYPTYDGNGNVSEYLNSSGTVVAHYEYDPFGRTTVATGSKAQEFSHRFSTKPLDATTGLYYYGYRYYDPVTGRWPSRDPIEEEGGVNLYGIIGNDAINWSDFLGLRTWEEIVAGGLTSYSELKELTMTEEEAITILTIFDKDKITTYEEVSEEIVAEKYVIEDWSIVKRKYIKSYCTCGEGEGLTIDERVKKVTRYRNELRAKIVLFTYYASSNEKKRVRLMLALAELAWITEMAMPSIRPPVAKVVQPRVRASFRRMPKDLNEQLALKGAKANMGEQIIESLSDPKFYKMQKWQYVTETSSGKKIVIHYVRDPVSERIMDCKFLNK